MNMDFYIIAGALAVNMAVSIATLILVASRRSRHDSAGDRWPKKDVGKASSDRERGPTETGVVFCRGCLMQYDSAMSACPGCGRRVRAGDVRR